MKNSRYLLLIVFFLASEAAFSHTCQGRQLIIKNSTSLSFRLETPIDSRLRFQPTTVLPQTTATGTIGTPNSKGVIAFIFANKDTYSIDYHYYVTSSGLGEVCHAWIDPQAGPFSSKNYTHFIHGDPENGEPMWVTLKSQIENM
jgi:hypothetical protein